MQISNRLQHAVTEARFTLRPSCRPPGLYPDGKRVTLVRYLSSPV
uniref:Uncharacterized protein n=1 Tax=Anguilla anguilla TaxID=7936 RepID=A0A0E9RXI0_ANGAN